MIKRVVLGLAAFSLAGLFLLTGAPSAAAAPGHVDGGCTGSGAFEKGGFTATAAEEGVVTIPEKDTVHWEGALPGDTGKVGYSGKIEVELPPPFGSLKIDSWSGTTDSTGNSGVKKYDIPAGVPRGVEFEVTGSHTQGPFNCSGFVKLKIDGSKFGPATIVSLLGTLGFGAGFAFAGRAKGI
jgi:hypothetical protein